MKLCSPPVALRYSFTIGPTLGTKVCHLYLHCLGLCSKTQPQSELSVRQVSEESKSCLISGGDSGDSWVLVWALDLLVKGRGCWLYCWVKGCTSEGSGLPRDEEQEHADNVQSLLLPLRLGEVIKKR